jgi:cytochrome P450
MTTEIKKYPPGPKSKLPFGYSQVIALFRDPVGFVTGLTKYGDIARYQVHGVNLYQLNNPDYIRDVLVTHQKNFGKGRSLYFLKHLIGEGLLSSEGEFHLRQRRLAQPAFHKKRIAAYADVMTGYSLRRQEKWETGQTLDMAEEMRELTLEVVAKTLFDKDIEVEAGLREALNGLHDWAERVLMPLWLAELLNKIPFLKATRDFRKSKAYLDKFLYNIITERRASKEDRGDLLSMLLQAQDEEGDHSGMTDRQVRDEVMTFFLAGHETTALALTWTWYLLSQNPAALAKLYAELDEVLAGRPPTMEDIPNLKYTEMVFTEAMRLYPPAYLITRWATKDFKFGDYEVPQGSVVILSPYAMHHNPRYFPEPDKFKPERWTPEAKANLPKFAYFPFGGGPRLCIGEPFAWMEGVLILATLAQKWEFDLIPGHPVKLDPLVTLRSKYGMQMLARRREGVTDRQLAGSASGD